MGLVTIYGIPFLALKKERKKGVSFVKLNQTIWQSLLKEIYDTLNTCYACHFQKIRNFGIVYVVNS
jgi:cbb3-type cytochrome oxidase cytochrome c subunit